MTPDQRGFIEKELARQAADLNLSDSDFQQWVNTGYTHKAICHYGKIFAVWRQFMGEPQVIDSIEIRAITCDTREGFGVKIQNKAGDTQWVGHTPTRAFRHPIFVHVPFLPEVSYMPRNEESPAFILRFPLVFKTSSNPKFQAVEGEVYVTQVGEFRNTFPQYKDLIL